MDESQNATPPTGEPLPPLIDALPYPCFLFRPNGGALVLAACNRAALAFTKGRAASLMGEAAEGIYHDKPDVLECIRQCRRDGGTVTLERPYRDPSGEETRFLSVSFTRTDDAAVLCSLIDLSHLRSNNETEHFYAVSQDLLCVLDGAGAFRHLNQTWSAMLGQSPDAIAASHFTELIHPDDLEATRLVFGKMQEGQTVRGFVNRLRCRDGSFRYLEWWAVPVDGLVYAAGRDITEKLNNENALIKAREATEQASHAKNEFLAHMSHQLFTPLNAIVGLGHLLSRTSLGPTQAEYLGKISAASHQLLQQVNDLLDFSQLETGRLTVENVDFDLPEVVRAAFDHAIRSAAAKDLRVSLELAPGLPATIRGDARRVHQILINLLDNAVSFTPSGQIQLRAGPFSAPAGEMVEFVVKDSGIGIAPERLPQLFQPFVPPGTKVSTASGGTGLGLVICHELLAMMGGSIAVVSEPEKGSSFRVLLPRDCRLQAPPSRDSPPASPASGKGKDNVLAGKRVLLVEDNDINRLVAMETLRLLGLEVVTASSGPQAINLVEQGHFDLVFMDIQMPDMDGYTTASIIRNNPDSAGMPIIALTAFAAEADRERSRQAGMVAHLGKPIDPEVLRRTIIDILDRNDQSPPGSGAAAAERYDRSAVLARLGGNARLLEELLDLFIEENSGTAATLRRMTAASEFEEAGRLVHTLKGSAANLSLEGIARLARQLETELRTDPHQVQNRISLLELALTTLAGDIEHSRQEAAQPAADARPPVAPPSAGQVRALLAELDLLLASSNYQAESFAYGLRPALETLPNLQPGCARMLRAIATLDYQAARRELAALAARLDEAGAA